MARPPALVTAARSVTGSYITNGEISENNKNLDPKPKTKLADGEAKITDNLEEWWARLGSN